MAVGGTKHAPNRGHVLNNGWDTSHAQKVCDRSWSMATNYTINAYTNHLFAIARINVGSKDSLLLQQSGHDDFKEL